MIEGGCDRCGMITYVIQDAANLPGIPKLICASCHSKYYSEEAIRDAKLKKLLKKTIWSKIKDFVGVGK